MRTNLDRSTRPADAAAPAPAGRGLLSPLNQSMALTCAWAGDLLSKGSDALDVGAMAGDTRACVAAVHSGDMRPIEAALLGQAEALGAMFMSLQLRARNTTDIERFRVFLALSLKAQAQSRATYETIAEVRNPRQVLIAKQANVAQQQVVNNGAGGHGGSHQAPPARTEAKANAPIELLEEPHEHSLDAGAARAPIDADSRVAAVGEVNRATDARGEGRRVKKRVQGRPAPSDA